MTRSLKYFAVGICECVLCVLLEVHIAVSYIIILRERDHLEDPGVDGGIILRRVFRVNGLDLSGSG